MKINRYVNRGELGIWGDSEQTRSFLYIDEYIEGVKRLMDSQFIVPVNIGSDEMVIINHHAEIAMCIAGKIQIIKHISGPLGVRGRNSNNDLINKKLGWKLNFPLIEGIIITYNWIENQINNK